MARRSGKKGARTRAIIDELFSHPPINQAELERRLGAIDPQAARALLVGRLEQGEVGEQDASLFAAIFHHLGVEEAYDNLLGIARDRTKTSHVRSRAMGVLAEEEPGELDTLMECLPPEDVTPLAELSLREMLATIQADPEQADSVTYVLESAPADAHLFMLEQIEHCRKQAGTSAVAAYSQVLEEDRFAHLRPQILGAIVEEGGIQGIELLERLRDLTACKVAHRDFQGALLRLRTHSIDPNASHDVPRGEAHLGSCDGQGAFILLGCFSNPDGSMTLADLCIRCAADVRDGFVIPRGTPEDALELLEEIQTGLGTAFVKIPLPQAAALVNAAVERTQAAEVSIPEDARPAVALFQRAHDAAISAPTPRVPSEPPRRVTLKRVRQLFEMQEYNLSWFFDLGDLDGVGVTLPSNKQVKVEWFRRVAAKLATAQIRRRVVAMARHMELWHGWREEHQLAGLCAALARATEDDFTSSPLVRVMLEQSLDPPDDCSLGDGGSYGDAVLRQHLKALFFQDVDVPRGKDLARLDLTEAALVSLDSIFDSLPGESRPREDERYATAYALGKTFVDFMVSGQQEPIEQLARGMTSALRKSSRLSWEQRHHVVLMILPLLGSYLEEVCAICPVGCLEKPRSRVEDVFFSPGHPVEAE